MIKVTNLSFGFPQKDLYNKVCFEIEAGDHAVLIGSNGCGKSTLVDMLLDPEKYLYDGKIERDDSIRIGYVSQYTSHEGEMPVYDFLAEPFVALQARADAICAEMETAEDMDEVYGRYQQVLDEQEAVDGYNYDTNIRKQLAIAGISELIDSTVDRISGGEYKLLSIIKNMLVKPQLLIMDEPDAFLDFENLIGLSKLINHYSGTILVISHNRLLLSQCFDKILHLENAELQEFPGTFAEYNTSLLETKTLTLEQAVKDAEWIEIQQKLVERMRADATRIANSSKGRQLRSRVSYLERLQARAVKNPFIEDHTFELHFPEIESENAADAVRNDSFDPPNSNTCESAGERPVILQVENYSLTFEKPILDRVSFSIREGEKVAIVGANGTGKSSILSDIVRAVRGEAVNGTQGAVRCSLTKEDAAYFSQIYEDTDTLSGGEKNIRQLREIAASGAKMLFLDEPTSHLDTYAQIALEKAVSEYSGTILMVTHDFYTVANCVTRILLIEDGTLREISPRAFRKMIYKRYFESDVFETERIRKETEVKVNALLKKGNYKEAKLLLGLE